ncbi:MAG: hypothetical protein WBF88_00900 [Pusillimonas sp.]
MGTANLTGTYNVNLGILIRASSPPNLFGQTLAASDCGLEAELELVGICNGCGELRAGSTSGSFLANNLYPSADAPPIATTCIPYTISGPGGSGPIQVVDNGDGTYTFLYNWSVVLATQTRAADTSTRVEITELRDCQTPGQFTKLGLTTVPDYFRTIPGTPLKAQYDNTVPVTPPGPDTFFNHATPDWRGCGEEQ